MSRQSNLLSAATLFVFSISNSYVSADNETPGFFINPHIGYSFFDHERGLDDSVFPGIGAGYQFASPWALELNYLSNQTDSDVASQGKVDFDQIRLDALYHLPRQKNWQMYGAFGVGENNFDSNGGDSDETVINIGGGLKYFLTDALSIRSDVRLFNSLDEEDKDMTLSLGLNYFFGQSPRKLKPEMTVGAPSSDTSGSENDGLNENEEGSQTDSDNDGVADSQDNCSDSKVGAKVNEQGCYVALQEAKEIELRINFANNSDVVPEQGIVRVQDLANFMREYPLSKVVVEGHTDDRGQSAYNQQLSERRASAVAEVLVRDLGVAENRVGAIGKGEVEPIASNDTAEGRAINRRVVGIISATIETRAQ